jgi:hypothetical protein
MVEPRKQASSDSTRIKFQSIFEPIDAHSRRTKIIATVKGNSTKADLLEMLDAGMNIASFNFTTGDQRVSRYFLTLISNTVFLLNHLEKRSRPDLANHAH